MKSASSHRCLFAPAVTVIAGDGSDLGEQRTSRYANVPSLGNGCFTAMLAAHPSRLMALLTLISVVGCGSRSGIERVYVSGKASYRGQPIEMGQIRFVPMSNSNGPITIDVIRDGAYATTTTGGVPVGTHRVELKMFDPKEYESTARTPGAPAVKQLLPDKYNRRSELTINIASGSDSIEHDFILTE